MQSRPFRAALALGAIALSVLGCAALPTVARQTQVQALSQQYGSEANAAWNSPVIASLRGKTALWDSQITPSMTQNQDRPNDEERRAALAWADRLSELNKFEVRIVMAQVPSVLASFFLPIVERYAKQDVDIVLLLYQGQASWGQFNSMQVENLAQYQKEMREMVAMALAAAGQVAAVQPPPAPRGPSAIELYLLQQQQQNAPRQQTVCRWMSPNWVCQ